MAAPRDTVEKGMKRVAECVEAGASIIDIGGESTRPGGTQVSAEEEIRRVIPLIEAVKNEFDIPVSVDTSKRKVAEAALESGADIVNDISGMRFDPNMADLISATNAGCVLMHLRGSFETMHKKTIEGSPLKTVVSEMKETLQTAIQAGIDKSKICLDVGIGFGKTLQQNLQLLVSLDSVSDCFPGVPLLLGVSRKSFLGEITGESDPKARVAATCAAHTFAICKGTDVLRVHDVKEAAQTVKVVAALRKAK